LANQYGIQFCELGLRARKSACRGSWAEQDCAYPEILDNCIHFDIRSVIAEWVLKLQSDGVSIKATAR